MKRICLACAKYIELNPVRAGLVKTLPLLKIIQTPWDRFLKKDVSHDEIELFRKHERTGRPTGHPNFMEHLEILFDHNLKPQKPGLKMKDS